MAKTTKSKPGLSFAEAVKQCLKDGTLGLSREANSIYYVDAYWWSNGWLAHSHLVGPYIYPSWHPSMRPTDAAATDWEVFKLSKFRRLYSWIKKHYTSPFSPRRRYVSSNRTI